MNHTLGNAVLAELSQAPSFEVVKEIPLGAYKQIEEAVKDFIKTSHLPSGIDSQGFYIQTLQAISNSTVLGGGGDFWLGMDGDQVVVYILGHFGNDLDGRLTYTVTQGWVRRDYRGKPIVKEWWAAIKQRAREAMAKHLIIVSSRNPRAYERLFGGGLAEYAVLLRQDL